MTVTKLSSRQAKKRTSLRERVSEAEWKVRTDLAAAYQLAVVYGWTDMILTHFSARVPDAENQFLLNAYGLMFDEVTASNLVKIDHQGNIVEDITWPKPLEEELEQAYQTYAKGHPWVREFELSPKSVVREMVEKGMTFSDVVSEYGIARAEGVLLRYLDLMA